MNRSHFQGNRRVGFTLVELLVVIAIIGILVGLLLPAVQQAREAARRMSCQNNLHQLSLALHNYESAFGRLPSGYVHRFGNGTEANFAGYAWGVALLPYIEQQALFDSFDTTLPVFDPANRVARETPLSSHLCPSDPFSQGTFVVRDDSSNPIEQYAASTYAANWGPASPTVNLDDTPDQSRGVFFRNSATRFSFITDGLSNTLAFGERTNGPIFSSVPITSGHPNYENAWSAAVRDVDDLGDDHGHMVLFETQFLPNELDGDDKGVAAPHSQLGVFGLCDGSTRNISVNIDRSVYNAIATPAGGEIVSAEDL